MPLRDGTRAVTVPIAPAPARSLRLGPPRPRSRAPCAAGAGTQDAWILFRFAGLGGHLWVTDGLMGHRGVMQALRGGASLLFTMLYLYDVLRRTSQQSQCCCPPRIPISGSRKALRFELGH